MSRLQQSPQSKPLIAFEHWQRGRMVQYLVIRAADVPEAVVNYQRNTRACLGYFGGQPRLTSARGEMKISPDNQRCNHGIVCEKLYELEDRRDGQFAQMKEALAEIQELSLQLLGGIDYEADPLELSPDNMTAHVGGLIYQICERVLVGERSRRGEIDSEREG
jgi:hypothetical protein